MLHLFTCHGCIMPRLAELLLMISMHSKIFSRQYFEIFFLPFPRKQVLTFHVNSLIVSNGDKLHEMSNRVFWEK